MYLPRKVPKCSSNTKSCEVSLLQSAQSITQQTRKQGTSRKWMKFFEVFSGIYRILRGKCHLWVLRVLASKHPKMLKFYVIEDCAKSVFLICLIFQENLVYPLKFLWKKTADPFLLFLRKMGVFYGTTFVKFPSWFPLENQHFWSKWPWKRFWPILAGWGARTEKKIRKNNLCYFFELWKKYWVSDHAQF